MKITFTTPRIMGLYGAPNTPHVELDYLATYVKHNGHEVDIIDLIRQR